MNKNINFVLTDEFPSCNLCDFVVVHQSESSVKQYHCNYTPASEGSDNALTSPVAFCSKWQYTGWMSNLNLDDSTSKKFLLIRFDDQHITHLRSLKNAK